MLVSAISTSNLSLSINLIILSRGINNLSGVLFQKGRVDELEKLYFSLNKNSGDNFYIEIQRHGDLNEKNFENFNLSISKKINAPIIATNEVYYLDKENNVYNTDDIIRNHDKPRVIGKYINGVLERFD